MKSLRQLYRIGLGPSSSHTMAPFTAVSMFLDAFPDAQNTVVTLYGSLAKTGRGHLTDMAIERAFTQAGKTVEVVFDTEASDIPHPNTMEILADCEGGKKHWRVLSTGGGEVQIFGDGAYGLTRENVEQPVYNFSRFDDIKAYCEKKDMRLYEYVIEQEGEEILDYLSEIWERMKASIDEGLRASGELAGGLNVKRKAKMLFSQKHIDESAETKENRIVCSYAFAVGEQNAGGGIIVTAPTCGASGVMPSVLRYMQKKRGFTDSEIINALATGGLIGNLIKTNASISGAECGCQAEIGSACAMTAGALGELYNMSINQIEYGAEICIEHHLGLTCDPIGGLVQIPCIERNAVAAMRAINAVSLANFLVDASMMNLDLVIDIMYQTGKDLAVGYRETSESGLAKLYDSIIKKKQIN